MILRYFLFFVAMAIAVIFSASLTTAATALLTSTNSIPTRQLQFEKRDDFFKGKPVPKIDAMSNDTINFTWGLAGVDNVENLKFATSLLISTSLLAICVGSYRMFISHQHYLRKVTSLGSERALYYFSQPKRGLSLFIEKNIITAPVFGTRVNQGLTMNFYNLHWGSLPTRLNFILVGLYLLSNVLYCTLLIPFHETTPAGNSVKTSMAARIAELRGRTGVMAVVNMIPLFICIMRNNWLGDSIGVGFNTWNLFHRWIGRVVFIESNAHMIAWMINKVNQSNFKEMNEEIGKSAFLLAGMISVAASWLIVVTSLPPLRRLFYQFFLGAHQVAVVLFLGGAYFHCHIDQLPHKSYVIGAMVLWGVERAMRICTILKKNWSGRHLSVGHIKAMRHGEDAVLLTVTIKGGWNYKPGTHAYIYMPRLSWLQSHPFSIAWSNPTPTSVPLTQMPESTVGSSSSLDNDVKAKETGDCTEYESTLVASPIDARKPELTSTVYPSERPPNPTYPNDRTIKSTDIHFIIARRAGFTDRLYRAACRAQYDFDQCPIAKEYGNTLDLERLASSSPKSFWTLVEGPYTNEAHGFDSFHSVLFVAGGSGITHPLGHIRNLLQLSRDHLAPTQRVKLVWVTQQMRNVEWIQPWIDELWRLNGGRNVLEIDIYVTRPKRDDVLERNGGPGTIKWMPGRPTWDVVVQGMISEKGATGALAVNVCGAGAIADNVRDSCRKQMDKVHIEFSEECFTWS